MLLVVSCLAPVYGVVSVTEHGDQDYIHADDIKWQILRSHVKVKTLPELFEKATPRIQPIFYAQFFAVKIGKKLSYLFKDWAIRRRGALTDLAAIKKLSG